MSDTPKTCGTCAHKNGSRCMLSGYRTDTERRYPFICGIDFHGWVKREPLITRIKKWLYQS